MKTRILYWPIALAIVFVVTGMSDEETGPAVLFVSLFSAFVGWFVVLRNTRRKPKAPERSDDYQPRHARSGIERQSDYQPRHRGKPGQDFKITTQNLKRNGYTIRDPEEFDSTEEVPF